MLSIFFHDTATTEIYTLSLHDALPILFFIVIVGLTRYVSIGSILGVFLFPIFMYIRHDSLGVWTSVILFLLVVYRHRENIYRLINGEERRIDFNRKK